MTQAEKGTGERALAEMVARAIFGEKVDSYEKVQKLSVRQLQGALGFRGNAVMFQRNSLALHT